MVSLQDHTWSWPETTFSLIADGKEEEPLGENNRWHAVLFVISLPQTGKPVSRLHNRIIMVCTITRYKCLPCHPRSRPARNWRLHTKEQVRRNWKPEQRSWKLPERRSWKWELRNCFRLYGQDHAGPFRRECQQPNRWGIRFSIPVGIVQIES